MSEWFIAVLVSVRDMAEKCEMGALAEELDIAILVAANEAWKETNGKIADTPQVSKEASNVVSIWEYH